MAIEQQIDPLVNLPSTSRPLEFNTDADALLNVDLPQLINQINIWAGQANQLSASLNAAASGGAFSMIYGFSNSTTDADPGPGVLRLNNATQNLSTEIRMDLEDATGADFTAAIGLFAESTSAVKGYLKIASVDDQNDFLLFAVSGVTEPSGYRKVQGTVVASSAASPLTNGGQVSVDFTPTGDKGDPGPFDGGVVSNPITLPGNPTNPLEATPKQYVDAMQQGLDIKGSVKAATTANITLSGAQTIDGVSITAGDRVLVKNQSTVANNGIYVAASGAWARALDMDDWAEIPGAFCFVEQGSTLANTGWTCTSDQGGTLGSTSITWTQFGAAIAYIEGAGVDITGTTISLDLNGLPEETAVDVVADLFVIHDTSANAPKKVKVVNSGLALKGRFDGRADFTTNQNLALSQVGSMLKMDSASDRTLTILQQTSIAWPADALIHVFRAGSGRVRILAGSGVSVDSAAGSQPYISAQKAAVTLWRESENQWYVLGAVSAT